MQTVAVGACTAAVVGDGVTGVFCGNEELQAASLAFAVAGRAWRAAHEVLAEAGAQLQALRAGEVS